MVLWRGLQVQLIGYCTVNGLFLIYEYIENGTLEQHLHGVGAEGMHLFQIFGLEARHCPCPYINLWLKAANEWAGLYACLFGKNPWEIV